MNSTPERMTPEAAQPWPTISDAQLRTYTETRKGRLDGTLSQALLDTRATLAALAQRVEEQAEQIAQLKRDVKAEEKSYGLAMDNLHSECLLRESAEALHAKEKARADALEKEAGRLDEWISVTERLPEGVRGHSYRQWATDVVLARHSDRPDYPITAHAYVGDLNCMGLGIGIPTNGASKHSGISWYCVGRDLNNPFDLRDQNYERFNPSRFGRCITHWRPLPAPPTPSEADDHG